MFTKNINFQIFKYKKKLFNYRKDLNLILNEKNQIISSLTEDYKDSFLKKN